MVFLGHRRISYRNIGGQRLQSWVHLIAIVVVVVVVGIGVVEIEIDNRNVVQCCTFWDDDVDVDIEVMRPNNYLQCSMHSLSDLREAVLRPESYCGVVDDDHDDDGDGDRQECCRMADMLRDGYKRWRVVSASRHFVIPTQPVHLTCMLQMECQDGGVVDGGGGGCNDMLFLLPYHEAMQTSGGIEAIEFPTKTRLKVELLKGIHDPVDNRCCCHDPLSVTSSDSGYPENRLSACRRTCFPAVYRIILPEVVMPGDAVKVRVEYYLGKPYSPLQHKLARDQQQRVTLGTSSLFQSPYHTTIQRTYFSLLEELNIEVLSLHAYATMSEIKQNVFLSGPYEKIELLSFGEEFVIAIDYHESLEFIPNLEKHAYVSLMSLSDHITVYESYVVYNDASPLEGHFSQRIMTDVETEKHDRSDNYVLYMDALFPREATDLRYYDDVGNIARTYPGKQKSSSSNTHPSNYKPVDLLPRFPLLGGWKTTFTLEYRLPYVTGDGDSSGGGKKETGSGDSRRRRGTTFDWLLRYASGRETVISMPVYPAVYYMYIDKAVIRVTLPPGAHVSRVSAPPYAGVEVRTKSRRLLLGITTAIEEVAIHAERMALHDMDDYEKERVEVAYKTSGLWLVKVIGALIVHAGIGYCLLRGLKS